MKNAWARIAALLLPVLLLGVDTLGAAALGWRPQGIVETGAIGIGTLFAAVVIILTAVPALRGYIVRHGAELALAAVAITLGWAGIEFGANALLQRIDARAPFHTRGPNIHRTIQPDPEYLPGIAGPTHFTTDARGIRVSAPQGKETRYRILCVGGSTTECVYLDDAKTWPALLAARLNEDGAAHVWVGNVGISGLDTRDHLKFIRESALLDGIDCVVLQIGINDLWRYLAQEETKTNYARFEAGTVNNARPGWNPGATAAGKDVGGVEAWRPLWTRSRVLQLWRARNRPVPKAEETEGIGGREYAIRREHRAKARIEDNLPDLSRGLAEYTARVRAIIAACRARKVDVVFTTQAVLWAADLPQGAAARCWFGWYADGRYASIAALRKAMDAYNTALREACAAEHVPCCGLDALNGNPAFFYDDCHFTEAGAREAAARITAMLARVRKE